VAKEGAREKPALQFYTAVATQKLVRHKTVMPS